MPIPIPNGVRAVFFCQSPGCKFREFAYPPNTSLANHLEQNPSHEVAARYVSSSYILPKGST